MAIGRIAIGLLMVIAPRKFGASWVGSDFDTPGASVLGRALGIRDAVFGGMLLHTLDHPQVGKRWTMTCGACDTFDGLSALAVRKDLPPVRGLGGTILALGSGAAHLALAQQLDGAAEGESAGASASEASAAQSTPAPASSPETVMPDGAEEAKRMMGARTIGGDHPA